MAVTTFLAMTAAEIYGKSTLPEHIGWMACHFSPYGLGLSNLPRGLPPGALLILNDRIPIHGHCPEIIEKQLEGILSRDNCAGLLLDFQRPECEETAELVHHLSQVLCCPVAVSESYAKETDGPVFLPPLPHHMPLSEYIAPWQDREIWLEVALDGEVITLTEDGAEIMPLSPFAFPEKWHMEKSLHCHYHIETKENSAIFTLWRTREDLERLLEEAEQLGIRKTVGLYQELH